MDDWGEDDWELDDWELDDWEEDAFDHDEWDVTQADPGADLDGDLGGEPDELDDGFGDDWDAAPGWGDGGGGGGGPVAEPRQVERRAEARPTVSAWDVGAGFALAGWLLDRHTDRIERAVGGQPSQPGSAPPRPPPQPTEQPSAVPVAAPAGTPIDWTVRAAAPGVAMTRSSLAVRLTREAADGAETACTLEPIAASAALRAVVIVTALTPPHRFWVVADEQPGGSAARGCCRCSPPTLTPAERSTAPSPPSAPSMPSSGPTPAKASS